MAYAQLPKKQIRFCIKYSILTFAKVNELATHAVLQ